MVEQAHINIDDITEVLLVFSLGASSRLNNHTVKGSQQRLPETTHKAHTVSACESSSLNSVIVTHHSTYVTLHTYSDLPPATQHTTKTAHTYQHIHQH